MSELWAGLCWWLVVWNPSHFLHVNLNINMCDRRAEALEPAQQMFRTTCTDSCLPNRCSEALTPGCPIDVENLSPLTQMFRTPVPCDLRPEALTVYFFPSIRPHRWKSGP